MSMGMRNLRLDMRQWRMPLLLQERWCLYLCLLWLPVRLKGVFLSSGSGSCSSCSLQVNGFASSKGLRVHPAPVQVSLAVLVDVPRIRVGNDLGRANQAP